MKNILDVGQFDLEKAYDMITRDNTWACELLKHVPEKCIASMYED